MKNQNKSKISYYQKVGWIYTKYQILTKIVLAVIVFPIFKFFLDALIKSTGRVGISSGDYVSFIFSLQGISFLALTFFVLAILVALDINAFVIISALIKENKISLNARQLALVAVKSIKSLFKPSGLIIMIYMALVVPLVGIGIGVSVTGNFKIPNFITSVIFNNHLYFAAYIMALLALTIITLIYIFFFHYLIIDRQSIRNSLKKSARLMKNHWKEFIKEFFIKLGLVYVGIIALVIVVISLLYSVEIESILLNRIYSIFVAISFAEALGYLALMTVPVVCHKLTTLFYKFNEEDGYKVCFDSDMRFEDVGGRLLRKIKVSAKIAFGMLIAFVLMLNLAVSLFLSLFFDDIFRNYNDIAIVAHRGGGDLAAENSILGIEKASEEGAKWSEIDVQRTKDGYYVINHDTSFARVADVDKKSDELTLEEIKTLKIKVLFNSNGQSQPVPTIEECLDASKGKIGLFIELKGSSADKKMADDIISMVKAREMEKEVALLSLDYELISYIEDSYPEIDTGFLYFFSIGDTKNLKGDILIMEEQEATDEKIKEIHSIGKKAIVWTVNTDDSVKRFVLSDVDGIITDHVRKVRDGIKARDSRSDIDIILDSVFE